MARDLANGFASAFYMKLERAGSGRQDLAFDASLPLFVNRLVIMPFLRSLIFTPGHSNVLEKVSAPGPVTGSRWNEAPLYVRRSGRRWQPANVARPPRDWPLHSGAFSGVVSPLREPPSAPAGSSWAQPNQRTAEGVLRYGCHRGPARAAAAPPPVSRIFWGG